MPTSRRSALGGQWDVRLARKTRAVHIEVLGFKDQLVRMNLYCKGEWP